MRRQYTRIVRWVLLFGGFLFFFLFDIAFSNSVRSEHSMLEPNYSYGRNTTQEISNNLSSLPEYKDFNTQLNRFIRQWGLSGASVAIAKDNRLLYARGFGYANREAEEPMQPYHIMRVASVSKLITAVALMQLVEAGQLKLDSKVFGPKGILNDQRYSHYIDSRVEQITVRQLLNHSAGWTTRWGDHLFMPQSIARQLNTALPIEQDDIITFALSRRLHYTPGSHSSYSNLGYLILERVIERTSGHSYERFVQENVFAPLLINDAFIAYNYDNLRYPLEVRYYEVPEATPVPAYDGSPYLVPKSRGGNDIRTLGAAGGWVMSVVSLTKLIMALESDDQERRVISKQSAAILEQTTPGIHPMGWRWVSSTGKKMRTGSFSGTSALTVVNNDGLIYVFITNSSPWVGARFPYEVDRFMNRTFNRVEQWPQVDILNPNLQPSTPPTLQDNPNELMANMISVIRPGQLCVEPSSADNSYLASFPAFE